MGVCRGWETEKEPTSLRVIATLQNQGKPFEGRHPSKRGSEIKKQIKTIH